MDSKLRIGIDIGGTFTDFVVFAPSSQKVETFKLLSSPLNPAETVLQGLDLIYKKWKINPGDTVSIIHGSTVATNALLERKGARTALVATRGFRDVIQIGRQNRQALYDLTPEIESTLVPSELRFEVNERISPSGEILIPLNISDTHALYSQINTHKPESIAVCLLFSFINPVHEEGITTALREAGYQVSASYEILPEFREYERTSTTVINAYVSPILKKYLDKLESSICADTPDSKNNVSLRIMQSNGGIMQIEEARQNGVRCILSGPAGGVTGARYIASLVNVHHLQTHGETAGKVDLPVLTFDMGGTSTDVSLIFGTPQISTEAVVGGYPIRIPVLDIHTIGAGGGSIASVDPGGALRVGPESAGAIPGPACYGKGMLPTVTDANLVLGRLQAEHFLGGNMSIDLDRATRSIRDLGEKLGMETSERLVPAALGVIEVVNAHMERALRVISVERGYDPRDFFALLSFGGAGGLHAVELARRLDVPRVIVPPLASTLSALGMLTANVVRDYTKTVMLPGETTFEEISKFYLPLVAQGLQDMEAEGILDDAVSIEKVADMRYKGQSYEIPIPFSDRYIIAFHEAHQRAYGTSKANGKVEIVNLRVRITGKVPSPELTPKPSGTSDASHAWLETRPVWFSSGLAQASLYHGELLSPGNIINGPAIIVRSDTTILIGLQDQAYVDSFLNLIVESRN